MKRNRISKIVAMIVVYVSIILQTACAGSDARSIWRNGIKKCAANDILGPKQLYFGPSNVLGPGTVFQKFSDGSYQQSNLLSEYGSSPGSNLAPAGTFGPCEVTSTNGFNLSASVPVEAFLPVSGTAGVSLKQASKVTVSAETITIDSLVTGPYRDMVLALAASNSVRRNILSEDHFVLSRAIKIHNMKAELEYSSTVGPNVKLSLPAGPVNSGNSGVNVTAEWSGTTKLTLKANSDFYIAGELRRFTETGLAGPEIGPIQDAGKAFFKR